MNWKNIKTVLIVVLAAVDIFFMLAIASAYRSNYFISENTIADAVQILADDDITVDAEAIPKKIPSPSAYMCAIGNDYEEQVASLTGRSDVLRRYSTPDGVIITLQNGSRYEFTDVTGLLYQREDMLDKTLPDSSAFAESVTGDLTARRYREIADAFISLYSDVRRAQYALETKVSAAYYSEADGLYYALCFQTLDGMTVQSGGFVIATDGTDVMALSGSVCFAAPDEKVQSQLVDQINILFTVKKYIGTLRLNAQDGSDSYFESPEITSLSLCCCVYTGSDDDGVFLYFIPGWQIEYGNQIRHVFNATDGALYTN